MGSGFRSSQKILELQKIIWERERLTVVTLVRGKDDQDKCKFPSVPFEDFIMFLFQSASNPTADFPAPSPSRVSPVSSTLFSGPPQSFSIFNSLNNSSVPIIFSPELIRHQYFTQSSSLSLEKKSPFTSSPLPTHQSTARETVGLSKSSPKLSPKGGEHSIHHNESIPCTSTGSGIQEKGGPSGFESRIKEETVLRRCSSSLSFYKNFSACYRPIRCHYDLENYALCCSSQWKDGDLSNLALMRRLTRSEPTDLKGTGHLTLQTHNDSNGGQGHHDSSIKVNSPYANITHKRMSRPSLIDTSGSEGFKKSSIGHTPRVSIQDGALIMEPERKASDAQSSKLYADLSKRRGTGANFSTISNGPPGRRDTRGTIFTSNLAYQPPSVEGSLHSDRGSEAGGPKSISRDVTPYPIKERSLPRHSQGFSDKKRLSKAGTSISSNYKSSREHSLPRGSLVPSQNESHSTSNRRTSQGTTHVSEQRRGTMRSDELNVFESDPGHEQSQTQRKSIQATPGRLEDSLPYLVHPELTQSPGGGTTKYSQSHRKSFGEHSQRLEEHRSGSLQKGSGHSEGSGHSGHDEHNHTRVSFQGSKGQVGSEGSVGSSRRSGVQEPEEGEEELENEQSPQRKQSHRKSFAVSDHSSRRQPFLPRDSIATQYDSRRKSEIPLEISQGHGLPSQSTMNKLLRHRESDLTIADGSGFITSSILGERPPLPTEEGASHHHHSPKDVLGDLDHSKEDGGPEVHTSHSQQKRRHSRKPSKSIGSIDRVGEQSRGPQKQLKHMQNQSLSMKLFMDTLYVAPQYGPRDT